MVKGNQLAERTSSLSTDRGLILPAYSGVAFLLSWIYLLFYANSAGMEAAAPVSLNGIPYTLSSLMMSAAVLVIAFGPAKLADCIMATKMKVISAAGTSFGTLLMICAEPANAIWLTFAGGVITGIFSGILAQQWVVAYRRIGIKTTLSSFPALLAVSTGICMTTMYLPRIVIFIVTVLMPIISGFMLHSVRKSLFPIFELETTVRDRPLDFVILIFPIGIFALSSGFLDFFSFQSSYTYFFYMAITAVLLIIAFVFILVSNRENAFRCIVLPLCFFICVFVPFFSMFSYMPAANFISIGELGIEIALFSIAVGFADFFSISALKSYALARVTYAVLCMVGWYVGSFASTALSDLMYSHASLAVVLIGVEVASVCLIVAIVKAQKAVPPAADEKAAAQKSLKNVGDGTVLESEISRKMGSSDQSEDERGGITISSTSRNDSTPIETAATEQAKFGSEARMLRLGSEYGLSDREMDVFSLLARGYSAAAIGGELYIAQGTVNYHTRNIYSKLGVHSKQELITLVSQPDA